TGVGFAQAALPSDRDHPVARSHALRMSNGGAAVRRDEATAPTAAAIKSTAASVVAAAAASTLRVDRRAIRRLAHATESEPARPGLVGAGTTSNTSGRLSATAAGAHGRAQRRVLLAGQAAPRSTIVRHVRARAAVEPCPAPRAGNKDAIADAEGSHS